MQLLTSATGHIEATLAAKLHLALQLLACLYAAACE